MKAAIYARNSKPPRGWKPSRRGEEPPGSWKSQLEALRSWANREGHEVVLEEHDTATGGDPNRRGWDKILAAARGHHIQLIAVVKPDRAMRSVPHFYKVTEELLGLGIDLIFTDSGMRLSKRDAMSKAMLGFMAVMAELELDIARERSAAVMQIGKDGRMVGPSGRAVGRPREYGPGHRYRIRLGRKTHDKARCAVCRTAGEMGGAAPRKG